ncbi:MAG TPA: hypothetical protein VIK53_09235 [Verrucomicrobiae bacterium]
MSLINDALKQARQAPPRNTPNSLPPLRPHADDSPSVFAWLIPAVVIILIVAGIFFIGWAAAHHTVRSIVAAPDSDNRAVQPVENVAPPVVTQEPEPPPPPVYSPDLPKLQGIFYSPTAPSAILDGKTVQPGDQFQQYKVKEISKSTVTLVGPDQKEIKIGMGN